MTIPLSYYTTDNSNLESMLLGKASQYPQKVTPRLCLALVRNEKISPAKLLELYKNGDIKQLNTLVQQAFAEAISMNPEKEARAYVKAGASRNSTIKKLIISSLLSAGAAVGAASASSYASGKFVQTTHALHAALNPAGHEWSGRKSDLTPEQINLQTMFIKLLHKYDRMGKIENASILALETLTSATLLAALYCLSLDLINKAERTSKLSTSKQQEDEFGKLMEVLEPVLQEQRASQIIFSVQ